MKKDITISFSIDEDMWKKARRYVVNKKMTIKELIEYLLKRELENKESISKKGDKDKNGILRLDKYEKESGALIEQMIRSPTPSPEECERIRERYEKLKQDEKAIRATPEQWEKIQERYKKLKEDTKAIRATPEAKEWHKLFRNWLAHITLYGKLKSASCPICGADWTNLVWKCHNLNIKEALEKAEEIYQKSIKQGSNIT